MGVKFDQEENRFVFDFEHDGNNDIIELTGSGYDVTAFGKCFYYGYEFGDHVDGAQRGAFIKHVKFSNELKGSTDLTRFIQRAVDSLHHKVNLYNFDLVIMPDQLSRLTRYMILYLYRFAQPVLMKFKEVKDMKECKSNILVVDDITTSGSTLNEILRALRTLNEDNNITIFSLIGRKDLTVDSMD